MAKKVLKVEEVKEVRKANAPFVLNMASVLDAIEKTPAKVKRVGKSGAFGPLKQAIVDIVNGAGRPVSIAQVYAGLSASQFPFSGDEKKDKKAVSDSIWNLAHKSQVIEACEEKGLYKAKSEASVEA